MIPEVRYKKKRMDRISIIQLKIETPEEKINSRGYDTEGPKAAAELETKGDHIEKEIT